MIRPGPACGGLRAGGGLLPPLGPCRPIPPREIFQARKRIRAGHPFLNPVRAVWGAVYRRGTPIDRARKWSPGFLTVTGVAWHFRSVFFWLQISPGAGRKPRFAGGGPAPPSAPLRPGRRSGASWAPQALRAPSGPPCHRTIISIRAGPCRDGVVRPNPRAGFVELGLPRFLPSCAGLGCRRSCRRGLGARLLTHWGSPISIPSAGVVRLHTEAR